MPTKKSVHHFINRYPILVVLLTLGLGACTTGNPSPNPAQGPIRETLSVCPGLRVSNAPATDRRGYIQGFRPLQKVKGIALLMAPAQGCLSSAYGRRRGGAGSIHKGIDLYTKSPTPFFAAGDGVISFIGRQRGYGRLIAIDHGKGVETRYAHLSTVREGLSVGKPVTRGTRLGETGRTGNATAIHLHYEILINGKQKDPFALMR
ncbi:MAG: M23 family metallopeptidase [Pseudomonadota bacterium]